MENLLFVVSGLFVIAWIMGIKGYLFIEGNVNFLLVMAFIAAIFGIFEYWSVFKRKVKVENNWVIHERKTDD